MKTSDIQTIAVLGAGIMGHGIAQEFASSGYSVYLYDPFPAALSKADSEISRNLENDPATRARLTLSTSLEESVTSADYVVEAVPERLELKQELFAQLDQLTQPEVILASNTSSFMPSQLAPSTTRPDKVLVTHYFNPPHVVPLVEIVKGPETSEETAATARELYEQIGKIPVVLQKERMGFIGNRLQLALFREALALVDDGVASVEDVDTVMHTSIGRRWSVAGVFEVFDQAGLDTAFSVATQLFPDLSNASGPTQEWLDRVEAGHHGTKTGSGFYQWTEEDADKSRSKIRTALRLTGADIEEKQES